MRISAYGTLPVFVERVIFLRKSGGRLLEREVLNFLRPNEVGVFEFGSESVPVEKVGGLSVVINGKVTSALRR